MRWPSIIRKIAAAIEAHATGVAVLPQSPYLTGVREYRVPSLDMQFLSATKDEVMEPARIQFNAHAATYDDLLDIGQMLEDLFDRDTWHTLDGIYMRSEKVEDGPDHGRDTDGYYHQSFDYLFETVRSKYVRVDEDS